MKVAEGHQMDGESRLDFLEGRMEEQSRNWERLFADIGRVDQRIDLTGNALSARIVTVSDTLSDRIDTLAVRIDAVSDILSARIDNLAARIDAVSDTLLARINTLAVRIDAVSDALSARIDRLDDRIDAAGRHLDGTINGVDEKFDRRFDTLQQELSKQFRWTIGVMVTLTIGVITAVLTR